MEQRLTVYSYYGDSDGEVERVTINPMSVDLVRTSDSLLLRQNTSVFRVQLDLEKRSVVLFVTKTDLDRIEEAVGYY